ncbi:unnamed protein product [Rotaria magnacalcarata]|uniref:Elongator complex protein 5 n=1 Tax=Rotaria magnacalcarata TaxID=392030 RepID=A0A816W9K9_9BILA|nr:unnamed protein product [Rotaria magnacalcarata]CAF3775352.1 unnamed protein product [Rotaria magnacalcarata]
MLSSRLNNQLKPSLILVIDENQSSSSVGFQFACAYACEALEKFSTVDILLTEHNESDWFHSHVFGKRKDLISKINVIDMFDDIHSTKKIEECLRTSTEKGLIIIESLPWLLLRASEGNLLRLLHNWSKSHVIIAVLPYDCVEESSLFKNLISISYITVRIKNLLKSEGIEAKIEQRSRTNVDTIKSCLTFSIDSQLNVINLREEKLSNRKLKSAANTNGPSKTDVTANLTFNLRLKDDEVVAKNNLILPYTKQHTQTPTDSCTIHYSYDKEDDIDEDEDEDLDL